MEICGNPRCRERDTRSGTRARCSAVPKDRSAPLSGNMRACSACAGDYEDPDRTAGPADDEEDSAGQFKAEDEFPEEAS